MPTFRLVPWTERPAHVDFGALASLWNAAAVGRHAFFPWSGAVLARQLDAAAGWDADGLILALTRDGRLAGAAQASVIEAWSGYTPAVALELLMVRPEHRGHGLGRALVGAVVDYARARRVHAVDAMGAWPYGPHFHALADGSERSGVFHDDEAMHACLSGAGFVDGRESVVMQRALAAADAAPPADAEIARGWRVHVSARAGENTWLDHCFRAWTLYDHVLVDENRYVHSRAIYGRMDGLSDHTGRDHYALFGVYSPPWARRSGCAYRNISALLSRLAGQEAATVELHCYADNEPAIGLYRRLGFTPKARTRKMTRTTG